MPDNSTISLYLFDNDSDDVTENYDLPNAESVAFSSSIKKEGTHSMGPFDATTDRLISPTITEAIKSVEGYVYIPTGYNFSRGGHFWEADFANRFYQFEGDFIFRFAGAPVSGGAHSLDTWHHLGVKWNDGGQSRGFVDNVEKVTTASTFVPTNVTHHIGGAKHSANLGCDAFLDSWRLSDVVRPSFPTPLISITAVIPSEGPAVGGSLVQVEGTDFGSKDVVTFDGVPATDIVVVDSTKLSMVAPPTDVGVHDVIVDFVP